MDYEKFQILKYIDDRRRKFKLLECMIERGAKLYVSAGGMEIKDYILLNEE